MAENYVTLVKETVLEVMEENGLSPISLEGSTHILQDTGLDSLALAVIVVKLEEKTEKDPFEEGFVTFNTIDELAALYEA